MPHADAVGTGVRGGWFFEVVVDAVETSNKGVVGLGPFVSQFPVAEIHAAVVADPDEGPLSRCGAVASFPNALAQLEIPQRHRDFLASGLEVALIHGARDVSQGSGVLKSVILPIPSLQQADPDFAWIEVDGVHLVVREIAECSSGFPQIVVTDFSTGVSGKQ